MGKKIKNIVLILLLSCSLTACSESDVVDQVENIVQAEDPNVLAVKGGTNSAYPDITYGEAFEAFFSSPTWEYFNGTKEGPDEDEDGEPDYIEENIDIVEFTGYCMYEDVEVKALIQFTLSKTEDTFEATYLSFNEIPQSTLMMNALLEKVFTNEDLEGNENQENKNKIREKNSSKKTDKQQSASDDSEYEYLDEFIELLNSYSDGPDLKGKKLRNYYKEQYDLWKSGEDYVNITINKKGKLVIPDHSAEFIGNWWDISSQRCYMEISSDGIYYYVDINWGSSAWDNTNWSFMGIYNEEAGGISYWGSRTEQTYNEDGTMDENCVYDDGEGFIWIGDDGMLYWDDAIEGQGDGCQFERES